MATTPRRRPPALEIDLHGLTAARAKSALLEVISRNRTRPGQTIRVIHGVGDGVLRGCVDQVAEIDPRVVSSQREPGNEGVTVLRIGDDLPRRSYTSTRYALDLDEPGERPRRRR